MTVGRLRFLTEGLLELLLKLDKKGWCFERTKTVRIYIRFQIVGIAAVKRDANNHY